MARGKGGGIHLRQPTRCDKPELRAISNQVGSFFPQRENFRLTPEGKAKSTEEVKTAKQWIFE